MSNNGANDEKTQTISPLSPIPVELWKVDAVRIRHPNVKAHQPLILRRGMRRLFKTKGSAKNYALAVRERYKILLTKKDDSYG